MLLLFENERDARIDLIKSKQLQKVTLQDAKPVQEKDSTPKEAKPSPRIKAVSRVFPESKPSKAPKEESEKVYHVKCDRCKREYNITEKYLKLRTLFGIPVDSYNCIICKNRNYIFTQEFTEDLIKQYSEYRNEHP